MKNSLAILLCWITFQAMSQNFNVEINSGNENATLLGKINKEALTREPYAEWFQKNYDEYTSDKEVIALLKKQLEDYTITAFMGTWCGDSKREVPRFYKVLDDAEFPLDRLTFVAVDRVREAYKKSPGGEQEELNIHRVPTFIVYKDGKEINRIVESPVKTLEEDLLQLLRKEYQPNYHGVSLAHDLLTEMGVQKFQSKNKKIAKKLKGEVQAFKELNTYSSVLFYNDQQEAAVAIGRLNLLLFPEEANAYIRLGVKLREMGQRSEALELFEKALELNPENEKLKSAISELNTK